MTKLAMSIIILTDRSDAIFLETLESAQIAKEVLIVDHMSGNDWKKLKTTYSFSIIKSVTEINNFSIIRNEAASYARYDWVFFLDSDEVIPSNARDFLTKCLTNTTIAGWYIKRKDYFLGKSLEHGETASTSLLRLYQKNKGHFHGAVHEICTVKGKTKNSTISLIHKSHTSISSFLTTIATYAHQVAKYKHPNKNNTQHKVIYIAELLIYPPAKFITNFIFKQGFRDGMRGFIYAIMMSLHSFFVRVYSYEHTT